MPKTGTTYLQSILFGSQPLLAEQGLQLIPDTRGGAFRLMLRVRNKVREFDPAEAAVALGHFESAMRASTAERILFTEESLARARPGQIEQLLQHAGGREVHLVVTYRDIARQLPSAWQQQVKAGGAIGFADYLARARSDGPGSSQGFWSAQDLVAVLNRWGRFVPPERTHVLVLGRGTHTDLLDQFCGVVGVDSESLNPGLARPNASVGRVQTELLAMVNARLPTETRRRDVWGKIGKRQFAEGMLARQQGEPARLTTADREWCEQVATSVRAKLESAPYHLVGDLDDVLPRHDAFTDRTEPESSELLEAAVAGLAALLEREARRLRRKASASPPAASRPESSSAAPQRRGWTRRWAKRTMR